MRRLSGQPLNILSLPLDGLFELSLAQLGYKVFIPTKAGNVNTSIKHKNLVYIDTEIHDMPISYELDCVLLNNKTNQYDMARQISGFFHIPMILAEHYLKPDTVKKEQVLILQQQKYFKRINLGNQIAESWGSTADLQINYYAPVTNLPKEDKVVAFGNFTQADAQMVWFLKNSIPKIRLVGTGLGVDASADLIHEICTCSTFINLVNSTRLPVPMLYALGAGARVITSSCHYKDDFNLLEVQAGEEIPKLLNAPFQSQQEKIERLYNQEQFSAIKNIFESIRNYTWK
jgi:hypothetical protein